MAPSGRTMGLVMALVTMLWAGATAQTGCTTAIISLMPCLGYISGNSSTPSRSCCTQLASVVQSQARCLCTVLGGGGSTLGLSINQTQALALPGACNVQTPPISDCNKAASPAESPTEPPVSQIAPQTTATPTEPPVSPIATSTPATQTEPSPTVPSTPSVPSIPSGSGSKTTPAAAGSTSNGSSTKLHFSLLSIILFAASYTSILTTF